LLEVEHMYYFEDSTRWPARREVPPRQGSNTAAKGPLMPCFPGDQSEHGVRAMAALTNERRTRMQAAIYCRVSSAGQEDNSSLETQEAACQAYARDHGWTVSGVFREVHTGAELFECPQLTRLREAMRRQEFDVLLVYALDRLSRK
jgi:hypothetical protein